MTLTLALNALGCLAIAVVTALKRMSVARRVMRFEIRSNLAFPFEW